MSPDVVLALAVVLVAPAWIAYLVCSWITHLVNRGR